MAIPTSVYAEMTPNPLTMKFVANRLLIQGNPLEFDDPYNTANSPLAARLFNFPFIKSVFIAGNFVSLTRNDKIDWEDVALEMREFIRDYLTEGNPVVLEEDMEIFEVREKTESLTKDAEPQNEMDERIIAILDEYVKPAVHQDGGNIFFKSFSKDEGIVSLVLQGACSGCPSSTLTLKSGIEGLLKRMVPEVKEVVAFNG